MKIAIADVGRFLARQAAALLFPDSCPGCGASGAAGLCAGCASRAAPEVPRCRRCGAPLGTAGACRACRGRPLSLGRVVVVGPYEGLLRTLVRRLKYGRRPSLARALGAMLAERVGRERVAADVVVPVPLDARRERERGFNQAELIAREVAERLGLPLAPHALARVRATPALYRRGARERAAAIAGAFAIRERARVAGRRVLLVDDILTTGATLSACASVCRAAGAIAVVGACAARRLRE